MSTYEWPDALDAVLRSLHDQSDGEFDAIVANDGSGAETRAVIDRWRDAFGDRLGHVWQPDEGFRLARALNLGALTTDAEYLVFFHGESVPRRHFVRALRRCARPGWFVAGRRLDVGTALTRHILEQDLPVHRWGFLDWWRVRYGVSPLGPLTRRDRRRVGARGVPDFVPHNRSYGYLLGVARGDFELVNGYDMRYEGWGEEDVDIAVRLGRAGLRCGHAGPDATLIHLWHASAMSESRPNWYLLQETERSDRIEAIEGLRELAAATRASAPGAG